MIYQIFNSRYHHDKTVDVLFATNDKQEAILVADDIGGGSVVVRNDEELSPEIVYIAPYKLDVGLAV
jgi:hypothetical protein